MPLALALRSLSFALMLVFSSSMSAHGVRALENGTASRAMRQREGSSLRADARALAIRPLVMNHRGRGRNRIQRNASASKDGRGLAALTGRTSFPAALASGRANTERFIVLGLPATRAP